MNHKQKKIYFLIYLLNLASAIFSLVKLAEIYDEYEKFFRNAKENNLEIYVNASSMLCKTDGAKL